MTESHDNEIEMWKRVALTQEEEALELDPLVASLRPNLFADYVGQTSIKENLMIACQAAQSRGEPLDHILLHGPPGLGKTSLA